MAAVAWALLTGMAAAGPRTANTTIAMPQSPGPPGTVTYLTEDAFPGVTFSLGPVRAIAPPGETNRLFVVENGGRVSVIPDLSAPSRQTVLDISPRVNNVTGEGLLGMAFHPDFATNRHFYTVYADDRAANGDGNGTLMILSRWTMQAGNPNAADPASELVILSQVAEWQYHNWNDLHFGADGYLYVAVGDEGKWDDLLGNSQRIDKDLFSGILRIDVDKKPGNLPPNPHPSVMTDTMDEAYYAIPSDNPFVGVTEWQGQAVDPAEVRTEFFAVGFRNPWRFCIDPVTGEILVGDVGGGLREEIDLVVSGGNYGWAYREGTRAGVKAPPVGSGGATLPGNLLLNASIEEGDGQSITHWQNTGQQYFYKEGAGAFGYDYADPGTFPDGIFAVKGFAGPEDGNPGISRLTQNVAVTGGQAYVAGAFFYHTNNPDNDAVAVASNSTRMMIEVVWRDAGNNPVRTDLSPAHHGANIAEIWAPTRLRLVAPANAVSADYSLLVRRDPGDPVWVSPGGGSLFADQLYFGDGGGLETPQLPNNLLSNDSIESGASNTDVTGWVNIGSASTYRHTTDGYGYNLGAGTFPDGNYALKQWGNASDLVQSGIPVTAGTPHVLRALTYHSSTEDVIDASALSTRLLLRVEWFDAASNSLRNDYTEAHHGLFPSDQWEEIGAVYTSPAGAVTADFHILTDSNSGSGSVWADLVYFGDGFPTSSSSGPPPSLNLTEPLLDYAHSTGSFGSDQGNSVTGGFVYRGDRFPELVGNYIFADWVSGNIWSMDHDGTTATGWTRLAVDPSIAALDPDPRNGDVLLSDTSEGKIKRLVSTITGGGTIPPTLAATGIFADPATLAVNPGVVPYDLNVPFWSDNALKTRWFSVPNLADTMAFAPEGNWEFPDGTVWIKHFSFELTPGDASSARRLETRVLVKNSTGAYGVTYRWGTSSADAVLVPEEGLDESFVIDLGGGNTRTQVWRYPSRSECMSCHTPQAGYALGFTTPQLNRDFDYGAGVVENQIAHLESCGYFSSPVSGKHLLRRLARHDDTAYSLEYRARSYLQANCAMCHVPGGNAGALWDGNIFTPLPDANLINGLLLTPTPDPLDRVIVPADPAHSMILNRISLRGVSQMPPLGSNLVDPDGVALITDWIGSLAAYRDFEAWQIAEFGSATAPGAGSDDDPDRDGRLNFLEFLTRTDPHDARSRWDGPEIRITAGQASIHFDRLANLGFEVQVTTDPNDPGSWAPLNTEDNAPVFASVDGTGSVTDPDPIEPKRFYRIRVYQP